MTIHLQNMTQSAGCYFIDYNYKTENIAACHLNDHETEKYAGCYLMTTRLKSIPIVIVIYISLTLRK